MSPAWLIAQISLHTPGAPVINRHASPSKKHFHQNLVLVTFLSWRCSTRQQVPADLPHSGVNAVPQVDRYIYFSSALEYKFETLVFYFS